MATNESLFASFYVSIEQVLERIKQGVYIREEALKGSFYVRDPKTNARVGLMQKLDDDKWLVRLVPVIYGVRNGRQFAYPNIQQPMNVAAQRLQQLGHTIPKNAVSFLTAEFAEMSNVITEFYVSAADYRKGVKDGIYEALPEYLYPKPARSTRRRTPAVEPQLDDDLTGLLITEE